MDVSSAELLSSFAGGWKPISSQNHSLTLSSAFLDTNYPSLLDLVGSFDPVSLLILLFFCCWGGALQKKPKAPSF